MSVAISPAASEHEPTAVVCDVMAPMAHPEIANFFFVVVALLNHFSCVGLCANRFGIHWQF